MTSKSRSATRKISAACGLCGALVVSTLLAEATSTTTTTTAKATTSAAPSTSPSNPTTQERLSQMPAWFAALSHRDPGERQEARSKLLSLERDDLPALRKLIEDSQPLSPSQAAAMHDIVIHVYLTGANYVKSTQAWIGLSLGSTISIVEGEEIEDAAQPERGVIVVDRFPGFCGYRSLEDGDIILSVKERPEAPLLTVKDFQSMIMTSRAGTVLHLEIIRQMRAIEVEVQLNARPEGIILDELNMREKEAEEYWNKYFAPLVTTNVL